MRTWPHATYQVLFCTHYRLQVVVHTSMHDNSDDNSGGLNCDLICLVFWFLAKQRSAAFAKKNEIKMNENEITRHTCLRSGSPPRCTRNKKAKGYHHILSAACCLLLCHDPEQSKWLASDTHEITSLQIIPYVSELFVACCVLPGMCCLAVAFYRVYGTRKYPENEALVSLIYTWYTYY